MYRRAFVARGSRLTVKCMLALVAAMALQGTVLAQDSSQPLNGANPLSFLSSLFNPKQTKLEELIQAKSFVQADAYLGSESSYFAGRSKEVAPLLRKLAVGLNEQMRFDLEAAASALSAEAGVPEIRVIPARVALSTAESLADRYERYAVFSDMSLRSAEHQALRSAIAAATLRFERDAIGAFLVFDHRLAQDFFESYPVRMTGASLFTQHGVVISQRIAAMNGPDLIAFLNRYQAFMTKGDVTRKAAASRYFELTLTDLGGAGSVKAILAATRKTMAAGLDIDAAAGGRIGFVEVTSKTLLGEGQIEFPTSVTLDVPMTPYKTDLDAAFAAAQSSAGDFVVVLDVALSRVDRSVTSKEERGSNLKTGTNREPNPAYEVGRSRVYQAQNELNRISNLNNGGNPIAALLGLALVVAQQKVLNDARAQLTSTPMVLSTDVLEPYSYSLSSISASKKLTANYYVIDKATRRYYKGTFDATETKSFRIAYNLNERDPNKGTILRGFDAETDIASFEKAPMSILASAILDDYVQNESKSMPIQNVLALREDMLADKNKALAAYKATQYSAKPVNDSRFESVVVVLNPKGPLGTGFYVAPDIVMTNFHVVDGSQFIEMRLRNGLETFGKVIKYDIRLDLALVKVQARGTPVNFFEGNELELGLSVDAIGHPKGLTFTLTRGIISAVRKKASVMAVGGKEVLFVQTDAAINPGNSGGPLFLADKVVGVSNNKLVGGSEGLGFAIHYSEVVSFLREALK